MTPVDEGKNRKADRRDGSGDDEGVLTHEGDNAHQCGAECGDKTLLARLFRGWRHWGRRWCGLGCGRCLGRGSRFFRIHGLPCESRRDAGIHFGQYLQDRHAAGLRIHGGAAEYVVGHILAAAILVRPTPQIRAVGFAEVAPAVVFFRLVKDALHRPRCHLTEAVRRHGERVDRGGLPCRERATAGGDKLGFLARPDNVLAIVQHPAKVHRGFAIVDRAHHEPRHAGFTLHCLILGAVGDDPAGDGFCRRLLTGQNLGGSPQLAVAGDGLLKCGGHADPFYSAMSGGLRTEKKRTTANAAAQPANAATVRP